MRFPSAVLLLVSLVALVAVAAILVARSPTLSSSLLPADQQSNLAGAAYGLASQVALGFAPPWNLGGDDFLAVDADVAGDEVSLDVAAAGSGMLFWKEYYVYDAASDGWSKHTFPNAPASGWLPDAASASVNVPLSTLAAESWVLVYACEPSGSGWKCGCFSKQDPLCKKWSIQSFAVEGAQGCIPAPETCNGLDDDCDGEVDEECSSGDCGASPLGCASLCAIPGKTFIDLCSGSYQEVYWLAQQSLWSTTVTVDGERYLIADKGEEGMHIYSLDDPDDPREVKKLGLPVNVAVEGQSIWCMDRGDTGPPAGTVCCGNHWSIKEQILYPPAVLDDFPYAVVAATQFGWDFVTIDDDPHYLRTGILPTGECFGGWRDNLYGSPPLLFQEENEVYMAWTPDAVTKMPDSTSRADGRAIYRIFGGGVTPETFDAGNAQPVATLPAVTPSSSYPRFTGHQGRLVTGGRTYLLYPQKGELTLYDVTTPTAPTVAAQLLSTELVDGDENAYAYLHPERPLLILIQSPHLYLYNLVEPATPSLVAKLTLATPITVSDFAIDAAGDLVVFSDYDGPIRILSLAGEARLLPELEPGLCRDASCPGCTPEMDNPTYMPRYNAFSLLEGGRYLLYRSAGVYSDIIDLHPCAEGEVD